MNMANLLKNPHSPMQIALKLIPDSYPVSGKA
jgi:hypothetical protein